MCSPFTITPSAPPPSPNKKSEFSNCSDLSHQSVSPPSSDLLMPWVICTGKTVFLQKIYDVEYCKDCDVIACNFVMNDLAITYQILILFDYAKKFGLKSS